MAQSYLRTIEFKVKDTALKDAVGKLGKSLGSIDKNVNKINKNFTGLSKALKGVAAEFRQIAKSSEELAKSSTKQKSPLDPKKLTQSAKGLVKIKQLLKDLKNTSSLLDGDGRKTKDFNEQTRAFSQFISKIAEGTKALANNEAVLKRQIAALSTAANNAKIGGELYTKSVQAQTRAEQALTFAQLKRISAQKQLYSTGSGAGFKNNKELLGMKVDNNIASLAIYRGELEKALSLVDMSSNEFKEIEAAIEKINKRLMTGNTIKTQEKDLDAQAKKDAKQKLDLAIKTTKARQDAMKAALRELNIIGKFAGKGLGEFFGVLGGKRGAIPQLLAGGTGLQGIKDLIRFVPLVDKKLKAQIRMWSEVGQKAITVIGGIRLASIGLSGVLGATTWVADAVKGFIQFEDAASKVIWSIEGQMGKAFSLFGRLARELPQLASAVAMTMPKLMGGMGLGGSPLGFMADGSASNQIADAVMGNRFESRRFGRQGPTDLQKNETRLQRLNQFLGQRNRSANDYVTILGKAVAVEREISRETKMQTIMREHANGTLARQMKQRDIARQKELRNRSRERRRSFEDRREAFEFQQAEFNAQTFMQPGTQAAMVPGRDPNRRVRKDVWARFQRMQQSRQQRRGRLNEGLMLGAGFPMLFGGGVGSVGGGVAGALLQSKMGPGAGFGAQILLSALGQQIDAFVVKTRELGDALRKPTENLQALRDAAGIAGTDIERTSKRLEQLGLKASAAELLTAQIGDFADMKALKGLSEAWQDLSNVFSKLTIQTMSLIAGPITKFMTMMSTALEGTVNATDAREFFNTLKGDKREEFQQRIGELMPSSKARNFLDKFDPFSKGNFQRAVGSGIPQNVWRTLKAEFDPESAPGLQADLDAKVQRIAGQDTKDLQAKVELEKKRLTMSSSAFEIETKALELSRQILEISWQKDELNKMEDGVEKDILQTKINKLVATKDLNAAELENFKTLNMLDGKWQEIGQTIESGVVNAIEGAIQGTKTLGEVASSVFNQIARQMLSMGVNAVLNNFMPGLFPARAEGGPVKGGSPYIVGEKGPELFVPGSSGNIVPNHEMGGANIVVNVDASGSEVEGNQGQAAELGRMLGAAIQAELIKEKRPGGLLAGR